MGNLMLRPSDLHGHMSTIRCQLHEVCAATDAIDEIDFDLTVVTLRQKLLAVVSDASARPRRAGEPSPRVEALARS